MISLCSRWLAVCALSSLLVTGAAAQERAVYELDDFVDPRSLGAEWEVDEPMVPGLSLGALRAYFGWVRDFQDRNAFTEESLSFAHVTGNYYSRRFQFGLGFTAMEVEPGGGQPQTRGGPNPVGLQRGFGVSDYRAQVRAGWYQLTEDTTATANPGEDPEPIVSRWLVTWTVQRREGVEPTHELSLEFDATNPVLPHMLGSFIYTWTTVEGQDAEHRLSYVFRDLLWSNDGNLRLTGRYGIGGERTFHHWRWGTARFEASLDVRIPKLRTMAHFVVAPAYRFNSRGVDNGFNVEAAVFLDASVFAKLF